VGEGNVVYGTNLDNHLYEGLLFVNHRDVQKTGLMPSTEGKHANWISKYGSVTFNFGGYQHVWAGMNEAGLVMSTMFLEETQPPVLDKRLPVSSGFWMQYLLDNCSTVEEVIASDRQVANIETVDHHLVCDSKGNSAVIEFLGDKMVYHTGVGMPMNVLTNSTYEESIKSRKERRLWRFFQRLRPFYRSSLFRFDLAAGRVRGFELGTVESVVEYAFDTLKLVSGNITQWSIVFDIVNRRVYFRTRVNPKIRFFGLDSFDFSGETPVKMLNVHEDLAGDVAGSFVDYSHEVCFQHMRDFHKDYQWRQYRRRVTPDELVEARLRHFEGFARAESKKVGGSD